MVDGEAAHVLEGAAHQSLFSFLSRRLFVSAGASSGKRVTRQSGSGEMDCRNPGRWYTTVWVGDQIDADRRAATRMVRYSHLNFPSRNAVESLAMAVLVVAVPITAFLVTPDHQQARLLRAVGISGAESPVEHAVFAENECFSFGATEAEVKAVQGPPRHTTGTTWFYGGSWVHFKNGRVAAWANSSLNPLRIRGSR